MHVGSSPLARGTLEHRPHIKAAPGLIPARAGNTSFPNDGAGIPWAHPRSRGEHEPCLCTQGSRRGSSPLARGTRSRPATPTSKSGLIPARAGNTLTPPSCSSPKRAHPRSRGEHDSYGDKVIKGAGSSPLARGTRHRRHQSPESNGLIPARAGNTLSVACRSYLSRAHPRSRGEHAATLFSVGSRSGSSPLARGTPGVDAACLVIVGLIPARAGNTNFLEIPAASPWAHPRSRGEHIHDDRRRINSLGSSPLARGTLVTHLCDNPLCGLIPARAGNTARL